MAAQARAWSAFYAPPQATLVISFICPTVAWHLPPRSLMYHLYTGSDSRGPVSCHVENSDEVPHHATLQERYPIDQRTEGDAESSSSRGSIRDRGGPRVYNPPTK